MYKVSSRQGGVPILYCRDPLCRTKYSHVIASARLSRMKKLINTSVWKKSIEVYFNRSWLFLLYFYDEYEVSLREKSEQMSSFREHF